MFQKKAFILTILLFGLLIQAVNLMFVSSTAHGAQENAAAEAAQALLSPSDFEVVASNLDNPRGLIFDADGALYIAEGGRGGDGDCTPGPTGADVCYGATGAITRVFNGTQERIVTGLPSIAGEDGGQAEGPNDIAFDHHGTLHVLIGLGADPAGRDDLGEEGGKLAQLASISESGEITYVADLGTFEANENPDGGLPDSNPFALLPTDNGFVVTDAGANDVVSVTPADTRVSADATIEVLAVFPTRMVELPDGTPIPMQAVPTGVAEGPDGAIYVAQLTGFPFPVDGARVYRVVPGEEPEIYVDGFTNILDIVFDSAGNLYVLEIATNGLLSGSQTGALTRVAPDGSRELIASTGLTLPTGMVIGPDGMIYVSNIGPAPGIAEVIRLNPKEPTAVHLNKMGSTTSTNVPVGPLALLGVLTTGLLFIWRREVK